MTKSRREPSQLRAHETQRAVIEGAGKIFDQAGYGLTSLADISEASGVSQGAMYFHFKSKGQIALAVIHEQHARSYAVIRQALATDDDPLDQLIHISRSIADQLLEDAVVRAGIRLAMSQIALQEPAAKFYEDWTEGASAIVTDAIEIGVIESSLSPVQLGRVLIGTFTGVQLMSEATTRRADLYEAPQSMWAMLIDAMVPAYRQPSARQLARDLFKD